MYIVALDIHSWLKVGHVTEYMLANRNCHVGCNKPDNDTEKPEGHVDENHGRLGHRAEQLPLIITLINQRPIQSVDVGVPQILILLVLVAIHSDIEVDKPCKYREPDQNPNDG